MIHHHESPEITLQKLNTNAETGLTSAEVKARQEQYGPNRLKEKKKKTNLQRFFEQFKDVMILILIAAAIVSFVVVILEKNWGELFEPALILLIVILNAIMGVYQEGKAEKALDALKNMSAPHARVIRDGKESIIDVLELVDEALQGGFLLFLAQAVFPVNSLQLGNLCRGKTGFGIGFELL